MELKDLINYGNKYYLDENDNIKEIISNTDIKEILNLQIERDNRLENFFKEKDENALEEEENFKLFNNQKNNDIEKIKDNYVFFKDKNLKKKWFFLFFNNNQPIHNDEYNKMNKISEYPQQFFFFDLIDLKIDDIYKEKEIILNENNIFKLIKEKSNHFFPKKLTFNIYMIFDDEIESKLIYLIPEFKKLEDIIINNKNDKFLEYFENDENFNFYFTYQDLYNIDNFYKKLNNDRPFISNILNKLGFKTFNKVIYFNEYNYKEKLGNNPFRNFKNNDLNCKRVIIFYNKINFILYEPIENWLNRQKISKKFKNQKKLQNYLSNIIFFENSMNIFFRFEDVKKRRLMLSLFMKKNQFEIDDKYFLFKNGDFKEIYNIIKDYINYEVNYEELYFKDKHLMKGINELKSYILQKIISDKNNNDLHLLNFYLNNPKNNENIIIGLLNKYKNIL
tara:strand:- start:16 stop:1362 length:1347 start_codon:yes stop_codon:yes gene_type:complete